MHDGTLHSRHAQVLPEWLALYYEDPLELVSGEGRRVLASDGEEYLDFFGGLLATMIGHSIPEIVDAVRSQAGRMFHSSTLYLIRKQVELAERIAARAPIDDPRVFFVNSGTEAVEAAMLLASSARSSNAFLALRGSYHGRSFATAAATGIAAWRPTHYSPVQVAFLQNGHKPTSAHPDLSDEEFTRLAVAELRETLAAVDSAPGFAGFLAEPILGAGGFLSPPPGYFRALHAVLREEGIPFIADEVQSAWGRTGRSFFAIEAEGVKPQAITFAKGLANGLSIGGVVAEAPLMNSIARNSISTAGGNPISMAAGLAVLDYIGDHDLQRNADVRGEELRDGLRRIAADCAMIGDVRGLGLMNGVELVHPVHGSPAPEATLLALEAARRRGLLIGRGGLGGNVLRITPPMTVTGAEIREALEKLEAALRDVERHYLGAESGGAS